MAFVTVFRHIPPPIIGSVGVIHDRAFEDFEERLDWLEAAGLPVERFDPKREPGEVATREPVRTLLAREGDRCLPLVLVNGIVILSGAYPSRGQLARAVGRAVATTAERGGADLRYEVGREADPARDHR